MKIDPQSLIEIGMCKTDVETVMGYTGTDDVVRRLRLFRSDILEDIHVKQQQLDRLDYIIEGVKRKNA